MQTKIAPQTVITHRGAKANKPINHFSNFLTFGEITPTKSDVVFAFSAVIVSIGIVHIISYVGRMWGLG